MRRNYFIEKEFQARFILRFCLLIILAGLLTIGMLYLLGMHSTTVSIVNSQAVVRTTSDFLLPILIQTVAIVTVIAGIITIIMTLLVSHKIAGPLYRFKKVMQSLGEGDFSFGFRIRHLDQFQDLSDDFNEMIKKVRQQLNVIKSNIESSRGKIKELMESGLPEQKQFLLNELKIIFDELNKKINYFKS